MTDATPYRTDVNEHNVDAFIESHDVVVLFLPDGAIVDPDLPRRLVDSCAAGLVPAALAIVEARHAPGLLAMFGVPSAPYLMVFRERVVLYAEPVSPSPEGLRGLLQQVMTLDMAKVHAEMEADRRAREALVTRRACPTMRRGPGAG